MSIYRPRRATVEAIGAVLNELGGQLLTRLTAPLQPAPLGLSPIPAEALTAQVETTYGFPPEGVIIIEGERIRYSGLTATAFTGLSRDDSVRRAYPADALVVLHADGASVYSDLDRARASMLVDSAEGVFLDVVGRNVGVPRYLSVDDATYRRLIRALAYMAGKGSRSAVDLALDIMLQGSTPAGDDGVLDAASATLTSSAAPFTDEMKGLRLRLRGAEAQNGRIVRIRRVIDASTVELDRRGGEQWRSADLADEAGVPWEILAWDVWTSPFAPGVMNVRISLPAAADGQGFTYLNADERVIAANVAQVSASAPVRQVLGVWLASDPDRTGTNYADDNNFAGSVITLSTPLPAPGVEVVISYANVPEADEAPTAGEDGEAGPPATAQIMSGLEERNQPAGRLWPAYVGSRAEVYRALLDAIRAEGVEVRLTEATF